MFTVSCYAFHPLIQRFVRLWRYVQIVSDILTCLLSTILCCQCANVMPLSPSSSSCDTKPSIQVFGVPISQPNKPKPELVDPGRASGEPLKEQHLMIDFTPRREDTPEIQARCQEFWEFAKKQPEMEGIMVYPQPNPMTQTMVQSNSLIEPIISTSSDPTSYTIGSSFSTQPYSKLHPLPAIHMMRKMDKKGAVKAAFVASEGNKYFP